MKVKKKTDIDADKTIEEKEIDKVKITIQQEPGFMGFMAAGKQKRLIEGLGYDCEVVVPTKATKVVYDESGDLIKQIAKLCSKMQIYFVLQFDAEFGYCVQLIYSGSLDRIWKPLTGLSFDLKVVLEEAVEKLVKRSVAVPPMSVPQMEAAPPVQVTTEANAAPFAEAMERALESIDNDTTQTPETETDDDEIDIPEEYTEDDELESLSNRLRPEEMLGEQVSAEKKAYKGSATKFAAGKLIMRGYINNEAQYAVEYKDASNHKRTVDVKPETVKLVPEKGDAPQAAKLQDATPVTLPGGSGVGAVTQIIQEF